MGEVGDVMFFPEKITRIKDSDRVLEVGPGSSPFPRADVLLELRYSSEEDYLLQCGDSGLQSVDDRMVYYDGNKFPFKDGEFDYIICSHVLEHVQDVEEFCKEVFRVGMAGYFEYPLVYYEYVYDIPAHLNVLKKVGGELVYMPKASLLQPKFLPVRQFWYDTLSAGHVATVRGLLMCLMEGFEWKEPFKVRPASGIAELAHPFPNIPRPEVETGVRWHLRSLLKAFFYKMRLNRNALSTLNRNIW